MVAIKDMEMPKSCYDCDGKKHCEVGIDGGWRTDIRVEGCPLVEIGTCKDYKHTGAIYADGDCFCIKYVLLREGTFYCADFEKMERKQ